MGDGCEGAFDGLVTGTAEDAGCPATGCATTDCAPTGCIGTTEPSAANCKQEGCERDDI